MADVNRLRQKVKDLENALKNANTGHGLPYPEYFDGTEEIGTYLNRFNKIATGHGWDYARSTTILPLYLRGEARAVYDSLANDEKDTWLKLTTNLSKGLSRYDSRETARRTLAERRQDKDESILEFAQALRKLVDRAFPNSSFSMVTGETNANREARLTSWKNDFTKDYFRNGIKIELKREVAYMRATTLEEAIAQARQVEQIQEALNAEKLMQNENQISEMAMNEIKSVQFEVDEIIQEFNNADYGDVDPDEIEFDNQNCQEFHHYTQDFQPNYNGDPDTNCSWHNNFDTDQDNFDQNCQECYGDEQFPESEQNLEDDAYLPERNNQRIEINSLSLPLILVLTIFCLLSPVLAEFQLENVRRVCAANSKPIQYDGNLIDDLEVHGKDERGIEEWPSLNFIFGDVDVAMAIEGEDGGFQVKHPKVNQWKKYETITKLAPKKMEVFMASSKDDEKNEKNSTDENAKRKCEKFTINDVHRYAVKLAKTQVVQEAQESNANLTKEMAMQEYH